MADSWESPIAALYDTQATEGAYDGCVTPARFSSLEEEYGRLREGIGLVDQSSCGKFRVAGSAAMDLINRLSLADLSRLAISRIMPSYMLNPDGTVLCDLYAVNRGDSFLLVTSGRPPQEVLGIIERERAAFAGAAEVTDLTRELALLGVQGPFAWELLKDLIGIRVLGTRYLEVMTGEHVDEIPVTVCRAGKTAEFAYLLEVDAGNAQALWQKLLEAGRQYDLAPCGVEAQDRCALEDRAVNTRIEGAQAANVLELNCRIMVSREKDDYIGREAVERAIEQGIRRRLVGICADRSEAPGDAETRARGARPRGRGDAETTESGEEGADDTRQGTRDAGRPSTGEALVAGSAIRYRGVLIGSVANAGYSYRLGKEIAVAFLDAAYAYAGLEYEVETRAGVLPVRTVSAPFIMNKSFTIRPQEDSYLTTAGFGG